MKIEPCKIQFIKTTQHLNPQIQNICFANGIDWKEGKCLVYRPKSPFLYIDKHSKLTFEDHGDCDVGGLSEGEESFKEDSRPELTAFDFILKYDQPDEPKKPEMAARNNAGKMPMSYLFDFPLAMFEFCRVCMNGAKKYKRDNWKKGRPYRDTIDSILRHIKAFQNGEGFYEETLPSGEIVKFHHLANAMWGCAALLEWSLSGRKDLDDRYKK